MIDYGKPASNQMQLDLGEKGAERMREAQEWIDEHPSEWEYFKSIARGQTDRNGVASAKLCIELVRFERRVSIKNAFAPCFSRIAMKEDQRCFFRTAKSQQDGFCEVAL